VAALAEPLRRGFATAGTDDGHTGGTAEWAMGHPEKLVDFGYRAVHETRLQSGAIVQAYYGKEAGRNYFVGCSDGGREALMEAQRSPTISMASSRALRRTTGLTPLPGICGMKEPCWTIRRERFHR